MKILPTFTYELEKWKSGYTLIAGLDEVGRGAFAGPVVTAAVMFSPFYKFKNNLLNKIDDSKRLSAKNREELAKYIKDEAICFSISEIDLPIINEKGIGKATQLSFKNAVSTLCHTSDYLLTDAFPIPGVNEKSQTAIVHGDRLSISIASASILAKVHRDNLMKLLHSTYPEYGFDKHVGYGTAYHRAQIKKYGLSPLHRTSFNLSRYSKNEA